MPKIRIDLLIVDSGHATSRSEAQRLLGAGSVVVDGEIVQRSNRRFPADAEIVITRPEMTYVSRGGHKLAAALAFFEVDPEGAYCLDVGISTGGFTDCLLQHGAVNVVGVDVGHGQLHSSLRTNPRVELRESVNARTISTDDFSEQFDIITVDVSFISLTLILPQLPQLLKTCGRLICLVKPQFEVGAGRLGKNGIVHDPALRLEALDKVHSAAERCGMSVVNSMDSPISGGDGNREYLSLLTHRP